jgi:hypothetical protein
MSSKSGTLANPGDCLDVTEEPIMAEERIPDDPYRVNRPAVDPRSPAQIDDDLQVDEELAEGPAGGLRIAMYALAAVVIVGAVLYGLNRPSTNPSGSASTAQSSTQSSPGTAPPGMRDVTPRANTSQGVTTGAAPAQPQTPPVASPPGSTVNPPANAANPQADSTTGPHTDK